MANAMLGKSSEVISKEHLKQKIDSLNTANKDWVPDTDVECPIGESPVIEDMLSKAPGLCRDDQELGEGSNEEQEVELENEVVGERASNKSEQVMSMVTRKVAAQQDESQAQEQVHQDGKDGESSRVEFTASSVRQRGNRNKAILMRERREHLK